GLCPYHDIGIYYTKLIKKFRTKWHINCQCKCKFCQDCNHGKNPTEGQDCHDASCNRCSSDNCPLEWDENAQESWTEKEYKRIDNKVKAVFEDNTDSRDYLLGRITFELQRYQLHVVQLNWFKTQWR